MAMLLEGLWIRSRGHELYACEHNDERITLRRRWWIVTACLLVAVVGSSLDRHSLERKW